MTDEKCELGKWELLIKHLEKKPKLETMIVTTVCIGFLMGIFFAGSGIREAARDLTTKVFLK